MTSENSILIKKFLFDSCKLKINENHILGCDLTTGTCKTHPDIPIDSSALSAGMKVILGVVAVVTILVILPALYAMYNMRLENRQRNARIKSQLDLDRMTQRTYLGEINRIHYSLHYLCLATDKRKRSFSKHFPLALLIIFMFNANFC